MARYGGTQRSSLGGTGVSAGLAAHVIVYAAASGSAECAVSTSVAASHAGRREPVDAVYYASRSAGEGSQPIVSDS